MSRLQTLNAPTQAFQNITIAATTGGRIDLSGLTTVNESVSTSKVVIEAQDPQSLVDLRSLNDSGAIEEIQVTTSGQIVLGDIDASNVDIAATENGQITANRITLLSNAVLHGSGIDGSVTNRLGRVEIDEPSMEISGQYFHDGGELTIPANTSLLIGDDYDNSAFGSGRDFNSRANIPGSGTILAVAAGQEITGDVTGGTSPRPTVSLGNVHVGKTLTRN